MKYPRYSAYKDSGVEWIGKIPEHWNIARFKRIAGTHKGKLISAPVYVRIHEDYIPYLSLEYLRNDTQPIQWMNSKDSPVVAKKGEILLIWDGSNAGEFVKAKFGAVSSTMALVTTKFVNEDYFFYVCKFIETQIKELTVGMGIPHIDANLLRDISIILPSIDEQKQITIYLESQITKIDALVTRLQKMIKLLQEKRQAIITHAVTKGLDPNVPMKDSGVEWIGGMPEQWKILQLKRVMSCNDEVIPENTSPDEELAYVEISDVDYPKGITDVKVLKFKNSPSRARRKVREGDIIISTVRTYLKAIAEIRNPPINMVVSTGFAVLRPRNIQQTFAKYVLSSKYFLEMTISESIGVGYPAINTDKLISIKIPVPNNDTQSKINEFLDHEIYKIDSLEFKLQKMTNILNDYRSSLISAAVTGKIDVRNIPLNESSRPELNDR